MKKRLFGVTFIFVVCLTLLFFAFRAEPTTASTCTPLEIFYMHGSGEHASTSQTGIKLKDAISTRLASGSYRFNTIENESDYPAIAIDPRSNWRETLAIDLGAIISNGSLGKYSNSVEIGTSSLEDRLTATSNQCPESRIVLLGYSQGADVIGRLLSRLDSTKLASIDYVGLMGDPRSNRSPLGGLNPFDVPWMRGTALIWSDGVLGAREPYLPQAFKNKVGSWCDNTDGICKGNILLAGSSAHLKYGDKYSQAIANELASVIATSNPSLVAPQQCGALKQDIVIALNVSPSVIADKYFLTENGIKKVVDGINEAGCDVRVGLVTFGRKGYEPSQPVFDLTATSQAPLGASLAGLASLPKSTTIEKPDIVGGLNLAMDLSWREDAQKAVIVMSDAPGDNYKENFNGLDDEDLVKQPAMQALLQKSREKGGIEFHAAHIYHPSNQQYIYTPGTISFNRYMSLLVGQTAGSFQDRNRCNFCSWLDMNFSYKTKLNEKPVVSVPDIRVKVGQSVDLVAKDVSGGLIPLALKRSYGVSYGWFVDCSQMGVGTLSGQTVKFTPTKTGTCHGAVVTREQSKYHCNICVEGDPYGMRAATPFTIEVLPADYTPPPLPSLVRNIKKDHVWEEDLIRITWDPPANVAEVGEVVYVVKDEDGNILGVTKSAQLEITDVSDDEDPLVLVSAASAGGYGGGTSTADAEDISSPLPEPEQTTGDVLGESRSGTSQSDPQQLLSNAQLVASPAPAVVRFKQITNPAQLPMPFAASVENTANLLSQGLVHNMNQAINAPTWLKLTIFAIPIVTAVALGLTLKYTLRLRAKDY